MINCRDEDCNFEVILLTSSRYVASFCHSLTNSWSNKFSLSNSSHSNFQMGTSLHSLLERIDSIYSGVFIKSNIGFIWATSLSLFLNTIILLYCPHIKFSLEKWGTCLLYKISHKQVDDFQPRVIVIKN